MLATEEGASAPGVLLGYEHDDLALVADAEGMHRLGDMTAQHDSDALTFEQ